MHAASLQATPLLDGAALLRDTHTGSEPRPPIAIPQHAITVHVTAVTEVAEPTAAIDSSDGLTEVEEVVAEVADDDIQPLSEVVAQVPLTPDEQISQIPHGALVRLVRDAYASGGISAEAIAAAAAQRRRVARRPSAAALAATAGTAARGAEEARRQAAAEGLELATSATSSTGFKGVSWQTGHCKRMSRFKAEIKGNGRREYLGSFASAEEAALAVARRDAAPRGPPPAPLVPRSDEPLAAAVAPTQLAAIAAARGAEEARRQAAARGAEEARRQAAARSAEEARHQAAAEGLELATSAKSSTGFECVFEQRGHDGRMTGRFKAEIRVNGRRECLGSYVSAEEAALAFARRRQGSEVEVHQGRKRYRDDASEAPRRS